MDTPVKNNIPSGDAPPKSPVKKSDAWHVVKKILDYTVPVAVSAVMVVWLFHKVNPAEILKIVKESCDYRWLLLMCAVLVASRSIRGIRWGIQLRAAGIPRMPAFAEMVSIYGAYALNLILSGVGEAWRCLYVARRQKGSLSTVIGTDLGDRISDAMMIISLVVLSLFVATPTLRRFADHYSVGRRIVEIAASPWLWIAVGVVIALVVWVMVANTRDSIVIKVRDEILKLWSGFKILFTMKHQLRFWTYTLLIWIAYFLLTYLCFFAFPFTRQLIRPDLAYGLLPGLIVFVFGSLSIAIPATGGLGPWNLAVMFALSLYGINQQDAATYSMVVWAFQTVTQILLGIVSALYITFHRRHPA